MMRFSVLIPSRNRCRLARTALETLLRQDFNDFEIIVSDNASDEDYAGMIASFTTRRVKYFRQAQPVPVTANWNSALERSSGEYVIMLGDDDALAPGSLVQLDQLIGRHGQPDVVCSMAYHYAYPKVLPNSPGGYLATVKPKPIFADRHEAPSFLEPARARSFGAQALKFRHLFGFNSQYFTWHRPFIDSLREAGPFFQSPYPDYYSAFVTMLKAQRILLDPEPRVIIGISPQSFGFYFHNDQLEAGNRMLGIDGSDEDRVWHMVPGAVDALALPGSSHYRNWLIAALCVMRNFGRDKDLEIDLRRFRRLQVFETAYQAACQSRLEPGLLSAFKQRLSSPEQRLFDHLYWTFAAMRRTPGLSMRHIHDALFGLFRIYPPPGVITHDIGQHVSIWDAWAWLDRHYVSDLAPTNSVPTGSEGEGSMRDRDTKLESVPTGSDEPGVRSSADENGTERIMEAGQDNASTSTGLPERPDVSPDLQQQASIVDSSGAFDAQWYLARYPDVRKAGVDPLLHYLSAGVGQGCEPNPVFDSYWYLERHADVREAGLNPLLHYLQYGASEGRDPSPLFDNDWYLAQCPDVRQTGVNPLGHYLRRGAVQGRDPNPLFDGDWYWAQYPDVARLGLNPLVHYRLVGAAEGHDPNPLFDSDWYLLRYPDVRQSTMNPLGHYLHYGATEGRCPNPLFDGTWYLSQYPEVRKTGVNPLVHYMKTGAAEGRDPNRLFDTDWYLSQYPEVRRSGMNPLVHYLVSGWRERYDPSPLFDGAWYLAHYSDVRQVGMNPLVHYLSAGASEGRRFVRRRAREPC